jgi:DNA-binding HxlR family transcriptional regulator
LRSKRQKPARVSVSKKQRTVKANQSVASIFKTISDPISVHLFKSLSENGSDSADLMSTTGISRRQYYSRLSDFTRHGMVVRKDGKNNRTTFGRVVYHTLMTVEKAFVNYYNLKALDSIGAYSDIPREEHNKIIDTLITDSDIRNILLSVKNKDAIEKGLLLET